LNTHTIHRFDKLEREHYFNQDVNLFPYLVANFGREMRAALLCPGELCRKGEQAALKNWPALRAVAIDGAMRSNASRECWGADS